ncbi:hypothetical protein Purlil1_3918 [Purpureocillium lilacinum]|uniref:Uncharacterized protein n=1 Tax=Purpureocillium lilacinum TaxID=33203 RepID=A0ABR0C6X4_PURLI|nr:hypothetical protein Purlil1_3918 [Purpureocillium lilacinum]
MSTWLLASQAGDLLRSLLLFLLSLLHLPVSSLGRRGEAGSSAPDRKAPHPRPPMAASTSTDQGMHSRTLPRRNDSLRSVSTDTTCVPQIQVLPPTRKAKPAKMREPRDTGFPEPFDEHHLHSTAPAGRNTTLPHPDADLSPDATISHEDVSGERALKRHRLSFLNKRKKTVSHGFINPQSEALYSGLVMPLMMGIDSSGREPPKLVSRSTWSLRVSKDGGESIRSLRRDGDDEETPPTSPDVSEHRGKKGFFGRLRPKS